jgi:predicted nucleotidyltransferase
MAPMTSPPVDEVCARLAAIESEHGVRVLYACESGSRAWGFASLDSDYDVRFIYMHALDWYLAVDHQRRRDVIEIPIDGLWDVNGWELRKALGLLAKSNPPLLEWLRSPIVYREDETTTARLRELAEAYFSPRSCHLHYVNMANANHREYLKGDVVWRKKYFYLLRPLLACRWIERDLGQVPMEFEAMLRRVDLDDDVIAAIETLLEQKRGSDELGRGPADPVLNAFIAAEREHQEAVAAAHPAGARPDMEPLNAFFREVVRG